MNVRLDDIFRLDWNHDCAHTEKGNGLYQSYLFVPFIFICYVLSWDSLSDL